MNTITVAGRLGRDMEIRTLPDGTSVGHFSVADDQGKDKPTIWWNCQLFGKRADALSAYLTKGQHVTVTGRIGEREWTDKEGNSRKTLEVRVSELALQGGAGQGAPQAAGHSGGQPTAAAHSADAGMAGMTDEIPF